MKAIKESGKVVHGKVFRRVTGMRPWTTRLGQT